MRTKLIKYENSRITVTGRVDKINKKAKTICIQNITSTSGELLTDHIWLKESDIKLGRQYLSKNDTIEFSGLITTYYKKAGMDYCFINVSIRRKITK